MRIWCWEVRWNLYEERARFAPAHLNKLADCVYSTEIDMFTIWYNIQ